MITAALENFFHGDACADDFRSRKAAQLPQPDQRGTGCKKIIYNQDTVCRGKVFLRDQNGVDASVSKAFDFLRPDIVRYVFCFSLL